MVIYVKLPRGPLSQFRMAHPESTQLFQFNAKGNMYIYAPVAGCTGAAKLVAPGDELIFSTSTQWQECEAPLLSEVLVKDDIGIASTCPPATETLWPFKPPLPDQDLVELSHKNFSTETMKKV